MSDEKFLDNMKQEIRTNMQSLQLPTPKIASEFYTAAEMVSTERERMKIMITRRYEFHFFRKHSKNQKR